MRAKAILFAMSVCAAFGQADTARVFKLQHILSDQDMDDFAAMIRTIAQVPQVSSDKVVKTISVSGNPVQVAIAEHLFTELDRGALPKPSTQAFRVPNNTDDVVQVFFLPNTATVQNFQEVATAVRTAAEIRWVYAYSAPRALALRGTADQLIAAGWLIKELDQPAGAKRADSAAHQMIDITNHGETEVRVFYLPFTASVQQFQEAATMVRTVAEIRRVFTYNAPKAVVARGTADQMALAAWLFKELGKPVPADTVASAAYTYPAVYNDPETIVRLFYVKGVPTLQAFQQLATQIRTTAKIRLVFTYSATMALAVRGTVGQLAMAEQMLKDRQIAAKSF